jgi:hypothetical protein
VVGLPWAGSKVLEHLGQKDSVFWGNVQPSLGNTSIGAMKPTNETRVLGLFNVAGRAKEAPLADEEAVVGKLDEIQHVVDSFFEKHRLAQKGVTMNFRAGPLTTKPFFDIDTKRVFLPQVSKEIALHELGHAADYTGSTLGKIRAVAEPVLRRAALVSVPIALIAGDELARAIPGTIDDKAIQFVQDHAPTIVGATVAATQLYPEAKASILALKHIKDVEGGAAALASVKKLLPAWGSYVLGAIPAIVGMALARRYMREARDHNQKNETAEKTAGVVGEALGAIKDSVLDLGHVARQLGHGVVQLARDPEVGQRIATAAKEVGTSPGFVVGALSSAMPATAGALYLYGTEPGRIIRQQIHRVGRSTKELLRSRPHDEQWRERHPAAFAGIVGLGAALSGGILHKMINDLQMVL